MHLDYRFYVKFRESSLLKEWLQNISIEAGDGIEYSLFEISKVFNSPSGMMKMMEPIGMIFDTVTAVDKEAFCFIHDHRKSFDFFMKLSEYLFDEVIRIAENDAVIIADVSNYDTDMMGDHIGYYLGGGAQNIKQCVVEGPVGLEQHEVEISNFNVMLKNENLTDDQKEKLQELTGGTFPENLMDSMRMSDMFSRSEEKLDMYAELEYVKVQLLAHTDEELLKICAEQPFLSEGDVSAITDGKPDLEKIAEAYIEVLMEDSGLAITDFEGFYNGDIEQFKAFAEADIESMFTAEE